MQRLLNSAENYVDEMLEGIYFAYPNQVTSVGNDLRCYVSKNVKPGKVGIVTGGGSGHLPLFLGYVGEGMLDGCCIGGVFQSPSADQILQTTAYVNQGAGVLYLFGNYSGDVMNFDMAAEMAQMEDINVMQIAAGDDVASAAKENSEKRRGVAGIVFLYKIAGAAAEAMLPLEEVYRLTQKAAENTRSMGVALSSCIIPEIGKPTFHMEDGSMEIGMGIHGETGVRRGKLKAADEVTEELMDSILRDLPYQDCDEVAVLVNGLGSTPREELFIIYLKIVEILITRHIKIVHNYIGEFATSMEMAGVSISLLRLDEELKKYLLMPCSTPFFVQK